MTAYDQIFTFPTSPIARDGKAQCDETRIVYEIMKRRSGSKKPGVMIDVGAHWGSSLKRFAADGWKVFAFEPDPANREKLTTAIKDQPHVVLSAEAVSDTTGSLVPFFASEESTGISSLSAFRDTHRQVAEVTTVTLNDVVQRHGIDHIDFLKIDVEGFEKAVLDGLDFDKIRPSCVVAEYEDAKTESLGYSVHDLARFLIDRGYSVFVSEWHPIERYGIKHSWRRIFEYPSEVLAGSWGNLVAFLDKPSTPILREAVLAATDMQIAGEGRSRINLPVQPKSKPADVSRGHRELVLAGMAAAVMGAIAAAFLAGWPLGGFLSVVFGAGLMLTGGALYFARDYSRRLAIKLPEQLRSELTRERGLITSDVHTLLQMNSVHLSQNEHSGGAKTEHSFQPFNRVLFREHVRVLQDEWAPRLSLASLKPTGIHYLASRIGGLERQMRGRLATTIEDVMLRALVAKSIRSERVEILEIGTLFGIGAAALHEAVRAGGRDAHLTLMDPLDGYYGHDALDIVTDIAINERTLRENLAIARIAPEDFTLIKAFSTDPAALEAARQRRYDLLVIDGDHTYDGVAVDFRLYGPLVKVGGYVIFDDYDQPAWPDVKRYVDGEMPACNWCVPVGMSWKTAVFQVVSEPPAAS